MKTTFSISEAVIFGWRKMKEHLWFLVGLLLFTSILTMGTGVIPGLSFLISIFASISMLTVLLMIHAGKKPDVKNLFDKYNIVLQYLVASVLYCLIVVIGLILFIIPGVYFALKYQFYRFLVVEKGLGPVEALKESGRITKGNIWKLLWFFWAMVGLNILGAIALLIGLFVTIPITLFAYVFVYHKLLAGAHHSA